MPVSPAELGQASQYVRNDITAMVPTINDLLADQGFIDSAINYRTSPEVEYRFKYDGVLTVGEIAFLESEFTDSAGWTQAVAANHKGVKGGDDYWVLTLVYTP